MTKKIALYSKNLNNTDYNTLEDILLQLQQHNCTVYAYPSLSAEINKLSTFNYNLAIKTIPEKENIKNVDIIIALGGDGTLLNTIVKLGDHNIPIVGINLGRLGFLNSVKKNEVKLLFDAINNDDYTIEKRELLQIQNCDEIPEHEAFALNDISILKRDTSSMIEVNAHLDGNFLNNYWADGLIIATPTGSTGYSLSCGGPLLWPTADNFVLTPVSAHNMNVRPFVVPNHLPLKLNVNARTDKFLISLDTRSYDVPNHKTFDVTLANFEVCLIRTSNYNYIDTLRKKLLWGMYSQE